MSKKPDMPRWVRQIVDSSSFWLMSRCILTLVFWAGAASSLVNFQDSAEQFRSVGLHPAGLYNLLLIAFLFVGSLLIVSNRLLWLAAGGLGFFLLLSIFFIHPFWKFTGTKRLDEAQLDFEHLSLIGGLMLLPIADSFRRRTRCDVAPQTGSVDAGAMGIDGPDRS